MTDTTARFRPRVIDVDAIQWTGTNATALTEFAGERFAETAPEDRTDDPDSTAALLETEHDAWFDLHVGDWVVRRCGAFEVLGEEEFADRYESAPLPAA
ncbi:hypothetical protein [Streptomyces sp. CS014]|uniref:hypothetical protein n=1 Tax=Streptomyces sp. CS014 TaxID=2162707 RepID=UPI000D64382A|nr:hypothetical protein [Streptomyces sp. CS014]